MREIWGLHCGDYKDYYLLVSWHMTLCSLVDMCHTFGGTCCLEHQGVLKIETEDSSRILVDTYHAEWHHILDDCDLQGECWLFWQFIKLNDGLSCIHISHNVMLLCP